VTATIRELAAAIGKRALWAAASGLVVEVIVVDVRRAYGRTDYQIRAKAGMGLAWVSSEAVEFPPTTESDK
jgi:hypothetical protein